MNLGHHTRRNQINILNVKQILSIVTSEFVTVSESYEDFITAFSGL